MKSKKKPDGIVYSTNPDFQYQYSGEKEEETLPPPKQDLRIWLEKNHRGGKQVAVIKGFAGTSADLENLARDLKNKCACGGSAKDGEIILQGDVRQKAMKYLTDNGYRVKLAGG